MSHHALINTLDMLILYICNFNFNTILFVYSNLKITFFYSNFNLLAQNKWTEMKRKDKNRKLRRQQK